MSHSADKKAFNLLVSQGLIGKISRQLEGKQAQTAATAASCPFYHAMVPAVPQSSLPSGCHRVRCQGQLAAGPPATAPASTQKPWLTREVHVCADGYMQQEHSRCFKASWRNVPHCLATPLMKSVTAANKMVWHGFKHNLKTMQSNTVSSKCTAPGVEGKHATIWIFLRRQKHGGNIMEVAILQAAREYQWL